MSILDEIIENKKSDISRLKKERPITGIQSIKKNNSFINILNDKRKNTFHLICEVKKASPSKGIIRENFNPVDLAVEYENGGASAISVLTDEKYFMGHLNYLKDIKKTVSVPVLRKDFIVDEYQIFESKKAGADMILLIAKVLQKKVIEEFILLSKKLSLDVLLEFSDLSEMNKIPSNYENVIFGINNRNLHTFTVDINNSLHIKHRLPSEAMVISESGIKTNDDCNRLHDAGFCGALIGETLMRADNVTDEIRKLKMGL